MASRGYEDAIVAEMSRRSADLLTGGEVKGRDLCLTDPEPLER